MTDNNSSGGSDGGNSSTNVINLNSLDHTVFQVPASDTKGHNTKLWFRLQPGHAQMIDRVVSSRKFPYRSQGDLLRHAILRHMHFLDALAPVPSVLAQVDAIIEVLRDEQFASEFSALFERIGARISAHMSHGSTGQARRLLLVVQKHMDAMPDGYWKDTYKEELASSYGYLLTESPKASLKHFKQGA